MDKKIVIIGANDFQKPLIQKAGEMGYETHVLPVGDGATLSVKLPEKEQNAQP